MSLFVVMVTVSIETSGETIGKDYVLHVLKCRSGYDKEAKAFCQEVDWSLHNFEKYDELRKIREHFGLPETEQILERNVIIKYVQFK